MAIDASAPRHKQSFDAFITERLPRLLAERLPVAGYDVKPAGDYVCRVVVTVSAKSGEVVVTYTGVPQPDGAGVFDVDGARRVVVPTASEEDLESADIRCVGEQLYDYVQQRLGEAPADLPWDENLLRSFLPLDVWMRQFIGGEVADRWVQNTELDGQARPTSQPLHEPNWLARQAHLRRIMIPTRQKLIVQTQFGRVCPFESPEGTNIGRVLHVAVGAAVREGRLVVGDDRPEACLGLTASMVPFLEHNDPNRQLFGVNMMRQWPTLPDPEPAYVQTGNEPNTPDFWCGRNLLTAFISLGADTFEDGIVISESAADRFDCPHPIEPGDKLSNRHGTKGTVSRILPDEEMPHLADGTPVELVFSFLGCHTRLNFGQIREAVMGRIARAEGTPAIVSPFHAPDDGRLRDRLAKAGLPESGMETVTLGSNGDELQRPSTVGWVYWGKTDNDARKIIHASVTTERCNLQTENEFYPLRDIGAFETIAETFNTRSVARHDAETLARRVAAGKIKQAGPPSPKFAELVRRLTLAGIRAELDGGKLKFTFAPPQGDAIEFACPVVHPWSRERKITEMGMVEDDSRQAALVQANRRMQSVLGGRAPRSLQDNALSQLQQRVNEWFDALLVEPATGVWASTSDMVRFANRVTFSGRTVISPGGDLRIDQMGLADEIAWTIFGPLVEREIRHGQDVQNRSHRAAEALDQIMAGSWIILNRAPTIMPTSLLAFHPVRVCENVIRLHPLATRLMNADFDGDQAAVYLPITEAGQREAGELLSVEAHLTRDPGLIKWLVPRMEPVWGMASLSLAPGGLAEIADLAGVEVRAPEGFVTHDTLVEAMQQVFDRHGARHMLDVLERLAQRGFEASRASGASISPFIGRSLRRPPAPTGDNLDAWSTHAEGLSERIASQTGFDTEDLGPQLLAVKSGARGSIMHLTWLLGARGMVRPFSHGDADAGPGASHVIVRNGLCQGLTPDEMLACTVGAREGLGQVALRCAQQGYEIRQTGQTKAFTVLARAMRAKRPGIVFAQAAATGEVDPLTDLDSRLFVGLPVR